MARRTTVDAKRVELAEAEREALELKIGGASYPAIAKHQKVSTTAAFERVHRALADITLAPATELKQLENERIEAVIAAMTVLARKAGPHQVAAAHVIIRASARLSKLHGLDAPSRRALEVATQDDYVALIQRLEAELPEESVR